LYTIDRCSGDRVCWSEVAEWLYEQNKLSIEDVVQARIVKEANVHFEVNEVPDEDFNPENWLPLRSLNSRKL